MDNNFQGPIISGITISRPKKPVLIDPCKKCLIQACCTEMCLERVEYFKTKAYEEYDQEKHGK